MKAICTWGQGPDVMVNLDGTRLVLYEGPKNDRPPRGSFTYGYIEQGSLDLTAKEAEGLANELLGAVKLVQHIEKELK